MPSFETHSWDQKYRTTYNFLKFVVTALWFSTKEKYVIGQVMLVQHTEAAGIFHQFRAEQGTDLDIQYSTIKYKRIWTENPQ